MDQINYVKAIKPIEGAHITGKPDDELAPPITAHEFLSVLMSLAYALLTRSDIEVYMIVLQKFLQKPKSIHIRRLNTLVIWAQKHPISIEIPAHDLCKDSRGSL